MSQACRPPFIWNSPSTLMATDGTALNVRALYQRCGFVTKSVQLYYHKWYV